MGGAEENTIIQGVVHGNGTGLSIGSIPVEKLFLIQPQINIQEDNNAILEPTPRNQLRADGGKAVRQSKINEIRDHFASGAKIVIISGIIGCGKDCLIRNYLSTAEQHQDIYITKTDRTTTNKDKLLECFIDACCFSSTQQAIHRLMDAELQHKRNAIDKLPANSILYFNTNNEVTPKFLNQLCAFPCRFIIATAATASVSNAICECIESSAVCHVSAEFNAQEEISFLEMKAIFLEIYNAHGGTDVIHDQRLRTLFESREYHAATISLIAKLCGEKRILFDNDKINRAIDDDIVTLLGDVTIPQEEERLAKMLSLFRGCDLTLNQSQQEKYRKSIHFLSTYELIHISGKNIISLNASFIPAFFERAKKQSDKIDKEMIADFLGNIDFFTCSDFSEKSRLVDSLIQLRKSLHELDGSENLHLLALLIEGYRHLGKLSEADALLKIIERQKEWETTDKKVCYQVAKLYHAIGHHNRALEWLNRHLSGKMPDTPKGATTYLLSAILKTRVLAARKNRRLHANESDIITRLSEYVSYAETQEPKTRSWMMYAVVIFMHRAFAATMMKSSQLKPLYRRMRQSLGRDDCKNSADGAVVEYELSISENFPWLEISSGWNMELLNKWYSKQVSKLLKNGRKMANLIKSIAIGDDLYESDPTDWLRWLYADDAQAKDHYAFLCHIDEELNKLGLRGALFSGVYTTTKLDFTKDIYHGIDASFVKLIEMDAAKRLPLYQFPLVDADIVEEILAYILLIRDSQSDPVQGCTSAIEKLRQIIDSVETLPHEYKYCLVPLYDLLGDLYFSFSKNGDSLSFGQIAHDCHRRALAIIDGNNADFFRKRLSLLSDIAVTTYDENQRVVICKELVSNTEGVSTNHCARCKGACALMKIYADDDAKAFRKYFINFVMMRFGKKDCDLQCLVNQCEKLYEHCVKGKKKIYAQFLQAFLRLAQGRKGELRPRRPVRSKRIKAASSLSVDIAKAAPPGKAIKTMHKQLPRPERQTQQILLLEEKMSCLSDGQLQAYTSEFKQALAQGKTLDEILPEAYAVCREAAWRVLKMKHYKEQILGGIYLHRGTIIEMKTGEGKTLAATLPAYLNALSGNGVHIITANDYLAKRDSEWMGKIYRFLGLSVDVVVENRETYRKRRAYAADITYGTNSTIGFDYLRDNTASSLMHTVQREHVFAIVDEADSLLLDEARRPLVLSDPVRHSHEFYARANDFAKKLSYQILPSGAAVIHPDVMVCEQTQNVGLTWSGLKKAEEFYGVEEFLRDEHQHAIHQALRAHGLYRNEKDYTVVNGQVKIIDEINGRISSGQRYSGGLHQALEAKEGVAILDEGKPIASITHQNFFKLYGKLSGMTGTAMTEKKEFREVYHLDVVEIPTHKPVIREDCQDAVYRTQAGKFKAVVDEIIKVHQTGRPILVGTVSVEKSEYISALLRMNGIPHEVLNAKHHDREAQIIAQAGKLNAVTIATNMAGRGTDIMLGGNPDVLARAALACEGMPYEFVEAATAQNYIEDFEILTMRERYNALFEEFEAKTEKEKRQVIAIGGLHVIGTERHESRRIDNQLRGRAGRQGDPGSSRFYVAMEDDLMRLFGGQRLSTFLARLSEEDMRLELRMLTESIERAQKRVEANHFSKRKHIFEYDDVINEQRKIIYQLRYEVLRGDDMHWRIMEMVNAQLDTIAAMHCNEQLGDWQLLQLCLHYNKVMHTSEFELSLFAKCVSYKDVVAVAFGVMENIYAVRTKEITEAGWRMLDLESTVLLRTVDDCWKKHIDAMECLLDDIQQRESAKGDALSIYRQEGLDLFGAMIDSIYERTVASLFSIRIGA